MNSTLASEHGLGPLRGVRLVEFSAIGPAPFGVMLLSDLGAEVVRIGRPNADWPDVPIVSRGRATLTLNLKDEDDLAYAAEIVAAADIIVEGLRPGVMESLGLGPEILCARFPRLIYARMTGWGQTGPLARTAGHDINYIGLTGVLASLADGTRPPVPPLNLLGDYGAGGLYLALGVIAALYEREKSGMGQVIDAAIVDGTASLFAPVLGMMAAGLLPAKPALGMLGGMHPSYRAYACADGRHFAVGALEPQFRARLATVLGIAADDLEDDQQADRIEGIFASRTRDEWAAVFEGEDCCASPVMEIDEAADSPHLAARSVYVGRGAARQPAPAPRFSRTPGAIQSGSDAPARLAAWGIAERVSR